MIHRMMNRYMLELVLVDMYLLMLALKVMGVFLGTDRIRLVLLATIIVLFVFETCAFLYKKHLKVSSVWCSVLLYTLYILFRLFAGRALSLSNLLSYLYFPLMFLLFYESCYNNLKKIDWSVFINVQIIVQAILAIAFFSSQIGISSRTSVNTIYYVVLLMPITMCTSKRVVRIIVILVCSILSLISLKLGACLSVFLALVFYYTFRKNLSKKRFMQVMKYAVLFLISLVLISVIIKSLTDYDIFSKVLSARDSGGSGRTQLWADTLDNITHSNAVGILFGHLTSSSSVNDLMHSAHNDYLEMIWRIGLIGFILFLLMIINLVSNTKRLITNQLSIFKGLSISSLVLLLFVMFVSQLVFVPAYSAYLLIGLGSFLSMNLSNSYVDEA